MIRAPGGIRRKGSDALAALAIALVLCTAGMSCTEAGTSAEASEGGADGGDGSADAEAAVPREAGLDASQADVSPGSDASAAASLTATSVTFPLVPCGGSVTQMLAVANRGSVPLAVAATTDGSAFSVAPTALMVAPGASGNVSVTAVVPSTATAGAAVVGSLNFFTNDPSHSSIAVPLSATPYGATLTFQPGGATSFAFPSGALHSPESLALTLQNTGNAPATFALGAPSDTSFTLGDPEAGLPAMALNANDLWPVTASFTPPDTSSRGATTTITPTAGTLCGSSLSSITLTGQGAIGDVTGYPTTIDFGPSDCGGSPPAEQAFTLTNTGTVDVHVTSVTSPGGGFTTNVRAGKFVPANGGLLRITVDAPSVPLNAPATTPITTKLSIFTDADAPGTSHDMTLSEEPSGAVLAFDTQPTPGFGSFGTVGLLQSATQSFDVTNTGSASASVTLVVTSSDASSDAGPPASGDSSAAEAGSDATVLGDGGAIAGVPPAFSVSIPSFTIGAASVQTDSVVFSPVVANLNSGSIAMVATGAICGTLPGPQSLSGSGLGGGPIVTPSSLSFSATCGGAAPAPQSFVVRNDGTADLTWSMTPPTGPGAAQYAVKASLAAGLLVPGASSTVTVTASSLASPLANPDPSAFAAQVAITTDVPLDPTHVVTLGVVPLGDQLSFVTAGPLRLGQVPIQSTIAQAVTVMNSANAGSPPASFAFALTGDGAGGYVAPAPLANVAAGSSASQNLVFAPVAATPYAATLAITTSDSLCTPLPSPLQLDGTGTKGQVSLSAITIAFGTDPTDPQGLVNCGSTGLTQTLTVTNVGNQTFDITGLSLGKTASPFSFPAALVASLPLTVPIQGSVSIGLTPSPIPQTIPTDPNDPTVFSDVLTVTTDAALDAPHAVALVMQARGAVIANTPLATTWSFGTATAGSIQTFTSSLRNSGNASVLIALEDLLQPSIFGLQSNPTTAPGAATLGGSVVTAITGQFTPPAPDGSWSDTGTLVVTAPQAFCAPLPNQWARPTISMSGATNRSAPLTYAGNLTFPATACGDAAPAGQAVTLTNATNVAYAYSVSFNSGKYYSFTTTSGPALDGGLGVDAGGPATIAANGTATIVVTPATIVPGAGVTPGSAPYADDLIVTVSTSPPTQATIPIAWTLSGAVLSLPEGAGPAIDGLGTPFYPADSTGAFRLPLANSGTAPASVDFAVAPFGAFLFSPAPPLSVGVGVGATPGLVSSSSDAVCPGATVATATFVYSGPVCQPFPVDAVTVEACAGVR